MSENESGCKLDFLALHKLARNECEPFFKKYDVEAFYKDLFTKIHERMNIFDLEPPEEGGCPHSRSFNQLQLPIIALLNAAIEEVFKSRLVVVLGKSLEAKRLSDERMRDGKIETEWLNRINAGDVQWARDYMAARILVFFGHEEINVFYKKLILEVETIIPASRMYEGDVATLVIDSIFSNVDLFAGSGVFYPVLFKMGIEHRRLY